MFVSLEALKACLSWRMQHIKGAQQHRIANTMGQTGKGDFDGNFEIARAALTGTRQALDRLCDRMGCRL